MKSAKKTRFFSLGRKWVFTLALFLLVFAAASAVKIQAAGNVTGWLWGGSEDANLGGVENCMIDPAASSCIDGDETGLGWISMNCKDREVALGKTCKDKNDPTFNPATNIVDYGVTFPSSGNASGYAWSEWVGWIDFSGVTVSTVGSEKRLSGSAQIISIVQAGANAGGWSGSIKMSGNGASWDGSSSSCTGTNDYGNNNQCNYGIKINSSGDFSGKAWNGEELGSGANMANGLGWIDFSRAQIVVVPYINLTPASFSLRGTAQKLDAQIYDAVPAGQTITFTKSGTDSSKFDLEDQAGNPANSCAVNGSGLCSIYVSANDRSSAFTARITATSAGFTPDFSDGTVIQALACNVSCPTSIEVISGGTKDYDVSIDGPVGCNALDSCQKMSGSGDISISQVDANTCRATAVSTTRYGSAVSQATAGSGQCDTNVNIKGPGWVETNP